MLLTRSERMLVFVLALITMSGPMSLTILFPALPVLEVEFGVSRAMVQVTTSLATLLIAPGVLIYGPLADRFGRRPPLLAALLMMGAGSVVCVFAPNIETLIAGRCMQGLGAAGCITLARVMLKDAFGQKRLPRMLAILTMAMMIGPMVAPALSGYMTDTLGWRSIFVFLTIFFILLIGLFWRIEETHGARPGGGRRAFRTLLTNPRFLRYSFATGMIVGAYYCFGAGAPHVIETMLGHSASTYGVWTMALSSFYFLGTMSSIWLGPQLGVNGSMMLGMTITTVTTFLLLALLYVFGASLTVLFIGMAPWAFGSGVFMPNSQAGSLTSAGRHAGTASAITAALQHAFGALGMQVVGSVLTDSPYPMVYCVLAFSVLTLGCVAIRAGSLRRAVRRAGA
ncbi:MAG: multidrug effflux MFS transporter [Gammaproteobacteria bacterium]|nr:multidrug effflux MFS transporter [Gammaproteobacteria bacterium]MXW44812.1 multidrug effflux MFS transporter [Gammaproteobacteria bacterium]MYD02061.1 multidrug effflux MFS transporter [Gammaproteobacteria bacterium]MYI24008.1 multidrug effflux MFS transporter [Gammaproteobacteria bacterium]